ncbi:MAG: hypothetical protein CMJ49_03455 [Planctomycetaceae bacterium]|nr:hypothetical protein [Planctomycetaceae bacterium]
MPRPRILCMVDLSMAPEALATLRDIADVDCHPSDQDLLIDIIDRYDALWLHTERRANAAMFRRASRLKVINTATTGTDHIDKAEAQQRGVRILSITRDYALLDTFTATAECAWMLMLACHRHLRGAVNYALAGGWNIGPHTGRQLSDRTLGVLGVGRLGKMTVEYGKAFRMRVLGCDTQPFQIRGVEPVDFDTLLREADAISIHIHLLPENVHLFNADAIAKMKPGSVLVNTSRGDIIDETALIAALDSGHIAAFGADVLHDEWRPDMRQSPLVAYAQHHDNVVITPHLGGATDKSIRDARLFAAKKLAHYLTTGEELTMA